MVYPDCDVFNISRLFFIQIAVYFNYVDVSIQVVIYFNSVVLFFRMDRIGGVWSIMGLSPERVTPNTMILVFGSSLLSTQHNGEKAKTGWFGIRIPCFSWVTCQSSDCCFSELAQQNFI
jgi:hypothetical protein